MLGPNRKTIIIIYGSIPTKDTKEREYSDINVKRASIAKFLKNDRYPQGITAKNYHKQVQKLEC